MKFISVGTPCYNMVDIDSDELLKHGDRIQVSVLSNAGKFIDHLLSGVLEKDRRAV